MVSFSHPSRNPAGPRGSGAQRRVGWRSVERQLPLMMTGVIASILAITWVMVHATLTESAHDVSAHRLAAAARQLAATYGDAFAAARNRALAVAKDAAVVNALLTAGGGNEAIARLETPDNSTPAEARLRSLLARTDSAVTAERWTADGRRVAYVGADVRSDVT